MGNSSRRNNIKLFSLVSSDTLTGILSLIKEILKTNKTLITHSEETKSIMKTSLQEKYDKINELNLHSMKFKISDDIKFILENLD